jgi:hypothetical protein
MSVKLAVQLFSNRVAKAFKYYRELKETQKTFAGNTIA